MFPTTIKYLDFLSLINTGCCADEWAFISKITACDRPHSTAQEEPVFTVMKGWIKNKWLRSTPVLITTGLCSPIGAVCWALCFSWQRQLLFLIRNYWDFIARDQSSTEWPRWEPASVVSNVWSLLCSHKSLITLKRGHFHHTVQISYFIIMVGTLIWVPNPYIQ